MGRTKSGHRTRGVVTNTRRAFVAAGGAGLVTAFAGCLGAASNESSDSTTTVDPSQETDFRLHWDRANNIYANITAAEEWTWPKQGVDVTVKTSNGGQAAAKSVSSGKEPFGTGGYGAVLQLIDSGAPLTVVANFTGPWGGVVSIDSTTLDSWSDVEGLTVGQFPFGSTPIVAKAAMRREGVDLDAVNFQNVQPGAGMQALKDGGIDALIRYIPQTKARLEMEGHDVHVLKSVDVLNHLGLALYAHDDVVADDPELVSKMVAGFIDGLKFWAENHDQVMDAQKDLVDEANWRPELNERMLGPVLAAQAPPKEVGREYGKGWITTDRLQKTIDIFHEAGAIDEAMDPETTFTNEFVEQNQSLAIETADALYERLEEFDVAPDYI
ncbi:MAG: ABC transporter substrate-binding protein [Halanaeroarchaeum sp.]